MLCRVADSLYWMSRYIERAENTARMVEVNLQLLLDAERLPETHLDSFWRPIMDSTGDITIFERLYPELNSQSVMEFLTLNRDNPSSVISCIFAARENARMIRDQISEELWEIINRLYHYLKTAGSPRIGQSSLYELFSRIKEYSHSFVGIAESTFPHEIGYEFIKAGRFLERADKTGRILVSKLHALDGGESEPEKIVQWAAVLRACSAMNTYRHRYKIEIVPAEVLRLLLCSRDFPRSMLYSLQQFQSAIHAVSGCPVTHYSNEAERRAGRLISDLSYSSVQELLARGIDKFFANAHSELDAIGSELSQLYMFFPVFDPATEDEPTTGQTQVQSKG
ncbi:MAG: alpha-E domain-containing protein [Opitutales bacterium]